MIRLFGRFFDYLSYLFFSTNRHGVHSPFVYDFADNVLYKQTDVAFEDIEYFRSQTINSSGKFNGLNLSDFTMKYTLKSKYCQLIYRMVKYYNINSYIEFGECTGIESCYLTSYALSLQNSNFKYHYISKSPNEIRKFTYNQYLSLHNMTGHTSSEVYHSDMKLFLFHITNNPESFSLQFEETLQNISHNDLVIVTNIRYSHEHYIAWKQITNLDKVSASIELFDMGIAIFSEKLQKENFILRY